MSRQTKNPIKLDRKNLQDFYSYYFSAAMAISGIIVILIIASLVSIISFEPALTAIVIIVIFLIFLPFSVYFQKKNQNFFLKTPAWMSKRTLKIIRDISIVLIIFLLLFGILFFPYSPIKPTTAGNTDKIGNVHTADEYEIFQKWINAYFFLWAIGALQGFVHIPITHWRSKDQWNNFLK